MDIFPPPFNFVLQVEKKGVREKDTRVLTLCIIKNSLLSKHAIFQQFLTMKLMNSMLIVNQMRSPVLLQIRSPVMLPIRSWGLMKQILTPMTLRRGGGMNGD